MGANTSDAQSVSHFSRQNYEIKIMERQCGVRPLNWDQMVGKDSGAELSLAEVITMLKQMSSNTTQQLLQQQQ